MRKFITFGEPNIGVKEINFLKKTISSKWIGSGPTTEKFEKKFKNYKKSKFSLSLNSCTAALHLSLISLGLKKGDEVITTPMTFCSTINSILLTGAKPILVDINPNTLNIDENKISKKINSKTKALMIVHFAGLACNMKPIIKICKKYNLKLIEDCAHAIESKYHNKEVGNFGDTGCFSFYATKNITTGEGGMLITNKTKIYNKIRTMRLHGLSKDAWKRYLPNNIINNKLKFEHYDVKEVGLKYNLIDLNASLGIPQLENIEKNLLKRKNLHNLYKKKLNGLPIKFQNINPYPNKFAHHLFVIILDKSKTNKKRDDLVLFLKKNKVGTGINYRAVTDMTIYKKNLGWNNKTTPLAKYVGDNILSLPLYPTLSFSEVEYITKKISEFFKK